MFVVDTNVLVYAADCDGPHHTACRARLELWRERPDAWFVTWGIVYEFIRVMTHARVLRNPWTAAGAWEFVAALLASPGFSVLVPTERHAEIAAGVIADIPHLSGNLVHDAHTAILMREAGVRRIVTRDTDFHRFPFLEVVDPLELVTGEPRRPALGTVPRGKRRAPRR